jgi:hypothetical protein
MSNLRSVSELQAETEENRIDFLRIDLALCFTFIDLANTESETGERDAAIRVCAKAEDGYATIARFVPEIKNPEHRSHITQKLAGLRAFLDVLQQKLHG